MNRIIEKLQKTGKDLDSFSYVSTMVKCKKMDCHKCPHGPYWYARYRVGTNVRAIYIGRHLPPELIPLAKKV